MAEGIAFIDIDGVLIEQPPVRPKYVLSAGDIVPYGHAFSAAATLSRAGYHVCLSSNKAAIGKGLMSHAFLSYLLGYLDGRIEAAGGKVDGSVICKHVPEAACMCRKPCMEAMIAYASSRGFAARQCLLADDRPENVAAARWAGMAGYLVRGPLGLHSAVREILNEDNGSLYYVPEA
jgi:D-glycero-D-manno-heptose 1,7-bisphosphate phosphatase